MNSEEYTSFSVALWTCKKTASDFDGRKKDASISSEVLQGGKKNSACLLWLCLGKTTLLAYFHYQYSIFFSSEKLAMALISSPIQKTCTNMHLKKKAKRSNW
jgi:hypothetical protein